MEFVSNEKIRFAQVHPDVRRYLENDCYCQHEVYDLSGFFYQLFYPEDDVLVIERNDRMAAVIARPEDPKPQAIMVWYDSEEPDRFGKILNMQRVDATENNIGILRSIVRGDEPDGRKLDEFKPGSTAKAINEVMSYADCVMIS